MDATRGERSETVGSDPMMASVLRRWLEGQVARGAERRIEAAE